MGGSSGGGGQTSTQNSDPWSGQQDYLKFGFSQAQNQFNSQNPQYYNGSTVAPMSDTTKNALDMTSQYAQNGSAFGNAAQNSMMKYANGDYLNGNPWLDANFKAGTGSITDAYNNAVNGQTAGFAGSGGLGSGMQAFYQNQQNDTLAKNLNNLYSNTYYDDYQKQQQNQMAAAGMAPQFQQMDYNNLNALQGVGSIYDNYAQNLTNADIDKWNYNQNLDANKLSQYMNMIQGNYGGTSTTTTPKSGNNMFGTVLSAGLGLAGLFSDRRLKTDITPIGLADNGLTIYSYRYVDSPEYHLGFMADEVEKVMPEAVTEDPSGYKMVNYKIATYTKV